MALQFVNWPQELIDEYNYSMFGYTLEFKEEVKEMAKWYAVMANANDDDWGTGSYCFDEAVCMAHTFGPDAYIAVIEEGTDKVCVEEIHDLPEARDLEDVPLNEWNDGELMFFIDNAVQFDEDSMTELIKRANLYDEEYGILSRWTGEPDDEHDIQDFFDEACEIIRAFHKRVGR